ncbi:MAG: RNA polymerase sigma factor [Opitutaceae bacterium]
MSLPPNAPGESLSVDQTRWFADEVQPHESSLRSYLKGSFPTVRDVDDVVQESYLRLWKARTAHPIQCARAFLFGIARRLAVDVIRKERRTTAHNVVMDFGALSVLEEKADAAETVSAQQEIALLAEAIHSLPARCREIMILRKLDRLSHREITQRLGVSASTVETQILRGMEKCTRYLRSRGVVNPRQGNPP